MKFDIKFSNIKHGWMSIDYKINNKVIHSSGSGVFNPLYDFSNLIISLKNKQLYTMVYDQEGSDLEVKILNYYNGNVLISICNWKDYKSSIKFKNGIEKLKYQRNIKKESFWINKKQLINTLTKSFITFNYKYLIPYINNENLLEKIDENYFNMYDFYFDIKNIKYGRITNKEYYNDKKEYKKLKRLYPFKNN